MAALADYDEYVSRLANPNMTIHSVKVTGANNSTGRFVDSWLGAALAGVAPTTAVAPTKATTGALFFENPGSEQTWLLGVPQAVQQIGAAATFWLCDRLSHQGGLSATDTTANLTTNLPTAALTRYTSGEGVMLGISIYTAIGATPQTITCNYTNTTAGASDSPARVIGGGNGFTEASRMHLVPLASGDTGVTAVNNSTLSGSTGTVGAFGYTLFKPLMAFTVDPAGAPVDINLLSGGMSNIGEILDDACLFWLWKGGGQSTQTYPQVLHLTMK